MRRKTKPRDWAAYGEQLVRRGQLLLDMSFLDSWDSELRTMNRHKRGRAFEYPDSAMAFLTGPHLLFNLPLRQTEGFALSLARFVPKLEVPDHATIGRRVNSLKVRLNPKTESDKDLVLAIDASGIKVTNRGEWRRRVSKTKSKKGYLKVHFAVDTKAKRIVAMRVTSERVGDSRKFRPLIKEASKKVRISRVLADGAYDSVANFNVLAERGIEAGIRVRCNARARARGSPARKLAVREQQANLRGWKKRVGYGHRWSAETVNSSFKGMFGEFVRAKRFANMVQEMRLKAHIYNCLLELTKFY